MSIFVLRVRGLLLSCLLVALLLCFGAGANIAKGGNDAPGVAATFSGTVTVAQTGAPLPAANVELLDPDGKVIETTTTDSAGAYHFIATGGPYVIYFNGPTARFGALCGIVERCSPAWIPQYYKGASSLRAATRVRSGSTPVTGLNAALTQVTFAGFVSNALTKAPLTGVTVELRSLTGSVVAKTRTAAKGQYLLTKWGGPYRLYVPTFCRANRCYAPQYYSDASSSRMAALMRSGKGGVSNVDIGLRRVVRHQPGWLQIINYWRRAAGLQMAQDQPAWDRGLRNHLNYLAHTPPRYMTGAYASLHTENPRSPYYTPSGAQAGASSDLFEGFTGTGAIDGWLAAPFHAVGMLRAGLTQVAFANLDGRAGLNVISGDTGAATTEPILFPGPGSTTRVLAESEGEAPSPLQTCGWESLSPGLPLILLLPQLPASHLTAALSGPGGIESTANHRLCVVDTHTFRTTDAVYGPAGREILYYDHAVFLIPKRHLVDGTYHVSVNQAGQNRIAWSFHAR